MTIAAWTVLVGTAFGGIWGARVYVHDQREDQEASDVRYCEQRVESRAQVRGVLLGLADRLGARTTTLIAIADYLDVEYPLITIDECLQALAIPEDPS